MLDTNHADETGDPATLLPVSCAAAILRPGRALPTEPAARVMTDFTRDLPVTVGADRLIDDALRDMMVAGVRALLVVRADSVVGLITSYDIQGERPLQFLASSGFSRHDEIAVGHIMTPWVEVAKLDMEWVSRARVADVGRHFRRTLASHIVVTERGGGGEMIRGLFSRTRIGSIGPRFSLTPLRRA
jgi:CBS-domain-containing membrane protein